MPFLKPRSRERRFSASSGAAHPWAAFRYVAAAVKAAARWSGKGYALIPQWHRPDTLSGRREVSVENGRSSHADRRLADASPEATARHQDRFHLRHLVDPHRIVGVEIRLLNAAILHGASAVE